MNPPVIVDTNVVVAGLITGNRTNPVALILNGMLSGKLLYLLSPALLEEYRSVLLRPKLVALHGLVESEVDQVLAEITANAMWREPAAARPAPDRNHDHLWALLDDFPGSVLITGDRLLQENPPRASVVVSPAGWIGGFAG